MEVMFLYAFKVILNGLAMRCRCFIWFCYILLLILFLLYMLFYCNLYAFCVKTREPASHHPSIPPSTEELWKSSWTAASLFYLKIAKSSAHTEDSWENYRGLPLFILGHLPGMLHTESLSHCEGSLQHLPHLFESMPSWHQASNLRLSENWTPWCHSLFNLHFFPHIWPHTSIIPHT